MNLADIVIPIYSDISSSPRTICAPINPETFDFPYCNDAVMKSWDYQLNQRTFEIDELDPPQTDLLEVKGFIFHTSHCGSTLLARMLNASSKVRVVSEPEAINGLLLSHLFYNFSEDFILDRLNRIINLYRQPIGDEKYLIIKMTSWNIFFRNFMRKLFPHIPWVYLDRDTEQVVDSLMRSSSGMVAWWELPDDKICDYFVDSRKGCANKKDYLTKLVNEHRRCANSQVSDSRLSLKYPEFIGEFEPRVLGHFNLKFNQIEIESALQELKYDSKSMNRESFLSRS